MIWSFAGPVILVALINFVFLVSALRVVATHRKHSTRSASKLSTWSGWIKSSVVLLSLLGITWALGVFLVNVETTFVAYLFTITNSLQGLFIFIFHCAMNEKLIIELTRLSKRSRFCPAFVQNRYDLRKWGPSSSSSQGTSSGTRRTISSKLSVNPSSSGLGVLDDTYFHSVTLPADQNNSDEVQPRKRTTVKRKEPKWVRNSERFNEEIDKTVGQAGMINKAFDDKIEELTIPTSEAMAGRTSTMHLVEEQSAL